MEDLFTKVLSKIKDGTKITFNSQNVAPGDTFLILYGDRECVVTFHTKDVPYWIEFSNDEQMLLEDVPESFLRSILKNIDEE